MTHWCNGNLPPFGVFWHGHDWAHRKLRIQSNADYWVPKIERIMACDALNGQLLEGLGWTVLRFWDFRVADELECCFAKILGALCSSSGKRSDRGRQCQPPILG